jgi:hypothetical protein
MWFTFRSWWRSKGKTLRRRPKYVPWVMELEQRTLPSTFTVLNLHDSGPGSLRAEIAAANANPGADTIVFDDELHGTIKLTSGELSITNSVTIQGPGANQLSVSGNKASRVFEIDVGLSVTISGLRITNGYAVYEGGGILNDGSNLTLSADSLTQNVVYESATDASVGATDLNANGGAVYSTSGTLTITGCQITSNQALGATGPASFGIAYGGGIFTQAGNLTITNTTINSNLVQGGNGSLLGYGIAGGVDSAGSLAITGCTISDNLATGGNNTPPSNDLGGGGGAVAAAGLQILAPSTITDCTFSGNTAIAGNGGSGVFVGEAEGGAIFDVSSATISGCTFDHNQAIGGSDGSSTASASLPTGVEPSIDTGYGGAINGFFGARLTAADCTFSHNQAIGGNNSTATGNDLVEAGDGEGGALDFSIGCAVTIANSTFDHNQAVGGHGNTASGRVVDVGFGEGGAILSWIGSDGLGSDYAPNTLTVSNSALTQNTATGGDNNSGSASLAGLVGAGVGAGIMNSFGSTATITGTELDHNQATGGQHNTAGGTGTVFASLGAGAAIFNYLGNYTSAPVSLDGYGPLNASLVTVTGSAITDNQAEGNGGNGLGGGIANLYGATTTVSSSFLALNEADGDHGGAGLGGGAYNDASSTLTLTDSLVILNRADGDPGIGGGVYNLGTFTFDVLSFIKFNEASTSHDNIFG